MSVEDTPFGSYDRYEIILITNTILASSSSMSSCNRNQNHLVHGRSTSRVIHPPGGQSSFSLGGSYGDEAYNRRSTKAAAPKPSQQMYRQSSSSSINDSLDSMIDSRDCSIPGLRDHYRGRQQQEPLSNYVVARCEPVENEPTYSNRRGGAQKAMSSVEYANELKRQISVRDTIRNSSRESLKNGSSAYREAENRDNYAYSQPKHADYGSNSRPPLATRSTSGRAPPGGHSTFSLGWD